MLLTKHEGVTFQNQTVYVSGQAFVRCNFVGCTLILREAVYHVEQCAFDRCNWHVDLLVLWASPESLQALKGLVGLMEQVQKQIAAQGDQGAATASATQNTEGAKA